jgi:hypothetical protein
MERGKNRIGIKFIFLENIGQTNLGHYCVKWVEVSNKDMTELFPTTDKMKSDYQYSRSRNLNLIRWIRDLQKLTENFVRI